MYLIVIRCLLQSLSLTFQSFFTKRCYLLCNSLFLSLWHLRHHLRTGLSNYLQNTGETRYTNTHLTRKLVWTKDISCISSRKLLDIVNRALRTLTIYRTVYVWISYQWNPNRNCRETLKGPVYCSVYLAECKLKTSVQSHKFHCRVSRTVLKTRGNFSPRQW